jgi:hypothetical protein
MSEKFPRREVAIRRVEWIVKPPDPDAEGDEYDRYETDRMELMAIIKEECGNAAPHDLRVIEGEDETIISYEVRRVVLSEGGVKLRP